MPIYEYRCGECKRRVSLFFPNFAAAESRTASGENRCPNCNSADLSRLVSRFNALKSEDVNIGGLSEDPDRLLAGLDDDDPRSVARWARRMKESMGETMEMGPEFDQALSRIESGEDPDKVLDSIDPEGLGGPPLPDEDFAEIGDMGGGYDI